MYCEKEKGLKAMTYEEVVKKAKNFDRKGDKKIKFKSCKTWLNGNQINLWTYWQGYQLKDIDKNGVDILLVGQDWGNPDNYPNVIKIIEDIQNGSKTANYPSNSSPTDKTLSEMFKVFGDNIDIRDKNPVMRLFFTNYSLGYREGSGTGGMTKRLLEEDSEFFDDLVNAIKPKIIICLGKITYEMVSVEVIKDFMYKLKKGELLKSYYGKRVKIPVYGVAHPGSRGLYNVGGKENMRKAWEKIAKEYKEL